MDKVFDQMMARYEMVHTQDRLNALHEVMHQVTLSALSRAGLFTKAAFYGGTCLRIFHQLPRFSEDMDFSLLQKDSSFKLEDYFDAIYDEFKAMGRDIQINKKVKKGDSNIESAFLKDNTEIVNVSFQTERSIKIKLEVDINPPLGFTTEYNLLLLPRSFMTRCFNLSGLFAGKIHALLFRNWRNRVKGRDWFDFEWYIRNNCPLDFQHLKARSLQSGYQGKDEFTQSVFHDLLKKRIAAVNFDLARQDVIPFIQNPNELEIWSNDYFLQLTESIHFEN